MISQIHDFFTGKFSRKVLLLLDIPLMTLSYWVLLYIAITFFPGEFDITRKYISNAGNPYYNPDGWIIWSVAHFFNGLFMLPAVLYSARLFEPLSKISKEESSGFKSGKKFLIFCSIGWMTMGLFPQYHGEFWNIIHGLNAVLLLGGYYFGMFCWSYFLVRSHHYPKVSAILILVLTWLIPICIVLVQIHRISIGLSLENSINDTAPWYFTIQTWEWLMLFGIYSAFLVLLIFPNNLRHFKTKKN